MWILLSNIYFFDTLRVLTRLQQQWGYWIPGTTPWQCGLWLKIQTNPLNDVTFLKEMTHLRALIHFLCHCNAHIHILLKIPVFPMKLTIFPSFSIWDMETYSSFLWYSQGFNSHSVINLEPSRITWLTED